MATLLAAHDENYVPGGSISLHKAGGRKKGKHGGNAHKHSMAVVKAKQSCATMLFSGLSNCNGADCSIGLSAQGPSKGVKAKTFGQSAIGNKNGTGRRALGEITNSRGVSQMKKVANKALVRIPSEPEWFGHLQDADAL